ncbi:MAG: choice-of-anchor I family protein [Anaerolineae bacterium]
MRTRLMIFALAIVLVFGAAANPGAAQEMQPQLKLLLTYRTGVFDEGAAEIAAFDAAGKQIFVINGAKDAVDVLDFSQTDTLTLKTSLDVEEYGSPTSVAVRDGVVAVAVKNDQELGKAVFFSTNGMQLSVVTVGAGPDMLTFSPDGKYVLVANEGEPSGDYTNDPEGSVSIIDLSGGATALTDANVTTASFADFNEGGSRAAELDAKVNIYGPNASVAQDLEPEYIAVTADSTKAYVTLQENNAVAVIDIATAKVDAIVALGYKDHNLPGMGLDTSDEDGKINIANYPIFGMYQPDAIVTFEANGATYLITANEGDTREYDAFSEETEIGDLKLDPATFPNAADLQKSEVAGRLNVTNTLGDENGDGMNEAIYVFGARSFSIWDAAGALVYDSGDELERRTAEAYPEDFNSDNAENDSFDNRSDNKGPEPEGVTVGVLDGRTYAFVGLERIGGIMVYDVTDPKMPVFVQYINNRDFSGDPQADTAGDLGPEGLVFVPADQSPTGNALLIVANEVSGSIGVYSFSK